MKQPTKPAKPSAPPKPKIDRITQAELGHAMAQKNQGERAVWEIAHRLKHGAVVEPGPLTAELTGEIASETFEPLEEIHAFDHGVAIERRE